MRIALKIILSLILILVVNAGTATAYLLITAPSDMAAIGGFALWLGSVGFYLWTMFVLWRGEVKKCIEKLYL